MLDLVKSPEFPGVLANSGGKQARYNDTREVREWCQDRAEREGPWLNVDFETGPNFFSWSNTRLGKLRGVFKKIEETRDWENWTPEQVKKLGKKLEWLNAFYRATRRELERRRQSSSIA